MHCQISRIVLLQHSAFCSVNCLSYFRNEYNCCCCWRHISKYFFIFFCSKVKDETQTLSSKLNKYTFIIWSSDHYINFIRNTLLAQWLPEDPVFSRRGRRFHPGLYTYDSVSFCDNEPTRAERQSVKLGCELIWVVERGGLARWLAAGRQEATETLPAVPSHTDLRPLPARSRRHEHISFTFHF